MTNTEYRAQEVSYQVGMSSTWRTKVCRTEAAYEKLVEKLLEQGTEFRVREA